MKFFYLCAGVLLALGIFLLLCDLAGVPTRRLSSSVRKVLKGKRQPQGDIFAGLIDRLAKLLAKYLPISADRIEQVQQSLDSAGITVPAKLYLSGCIAQAVIFFFYCLFLLFPSSPQAHAATGASKILLNLLRAAQRQFLLIVLPENHFAQRLQ